tara:strand:- start:5577 stop:5708 length:132 start_codon:yes stop_codon:yes gene_type:complete
MVLHIALIVIVFLLVVNIKIAIKIWETIVFIGKEIEEIISRKN